MVDDGEDMENIIDVFENEGDLQKFYDPSGKI